MASLIIKNRKQLSNSPLRTHALDIIEAGIGAVLPCSVMHSSLSYNASSDTMTVNGVSHRLSGRVFVVGGGKASGAMAAALETIIPAQRLTTGIVTCKGGDYLTRKVNVITAGHPVPDERGVRAVREMLGLKAQYGLTARDTIICLISGGGSALMPCPAEGITLQGKQVVTRLLLASGAGIHEINTVRKHLSCVKGGRLGMALAPAQVISLIISDVVGNDPAAVASGPTVPDPTTYADALDVLGKYGLVNRCPASVVEHLHKGTAGVVPETPKHLDNCSNYIIADNRLALEAMRQKATALGYNPLIVTAEQTGDTVSVTRQRAAEIMRGDYAGHDAIIIGGETTPTLPALSGKGGRNQHYALASLAEMRHYPGEWLLASVGTDGSDYMAEVAGAIVDRQSLERARGLDMESHLKRYDSYTLLNALGNSLIVTGETGTNVGDVVVYLRGSQTQRSKVKPTADRSRLKTDQLQHDMRSRAHSPRATGF